MNLFFKNKIVIFRVIGVLFLLFGTLIHFWKVPEATLSQNERAAMNLARMEASLSASNSSLRSESKKSTSVYMKDLKKTQEKQLEYLTILVMFIGAISLGYSFIKREEGI